MPPCLDFSVGVGIELGSSSLCDKHFTNQLGFQPAFKVFKGRDDCVCILCDTWEGAGDSYCIVFRMNPHHKQTAGPSRGEGGAEPLPPPAVAQKELQKKRLLHCTQLVLGTSLMISSANCVWTSIANPFSSSRPGKESLSSNTVMVCPSDTL